MIRWCDAGMIGVLVTALAAPAPVRAEESSPVTPVAPEGDQDEPATPSGDAEGQPPQAGDAAQPQPAEGAAQPQPTGDAARPPPAEDGRPPQPSGVSESVVRMGRIEMILIQNEDPESAIEFAQEVISQDGDHPRPRLLIAASYMRLDQPEAAIEHYARAIRQTERVDPENHLHAIYGLARALQQAGQLEEAAQAYDQYVAFASQHSELTSFPSFAQRVAEVLRARVAATSDRRRR